MVKVVLGMVPIALLVGACVGGIDPFEVAEITNETDHAVIVYFDYPDSETDFMTLSPGESDFTNFSYPTDGCAPATMIARDSSGVEVDRMDETFCVGDRWEIRNSNSDTSQLPIGLTVRATLVYSLPSRWQRAGR